MSAVTTVAPVVLEPAAQAAVDASAHSPSLAQLGPVEGRKALDEAQSGGVQKPDVLIEDRTIPGGPSGEVSIRILRPCDVAGPLPVILYTHGAGWVFGDAVTHDRLIRELAVGVGAAVVFTNYDRSPEARYPAAIEEIYAVLTWIAGTGGEDEGLDSGRIAVAGDSVGGNMTAAITLMAKQRSGPRLAGQVLFYPVTDASFDTGSYSQFGEGYPLSREGMEWFWDQYTTDGDQRAEITASPLRATTEDLAGLPKALVITAEADVLRDEGEAYGRKLRESGVDVAATRYEGIIHDFVMLDDLRVTNAAGAAMGQAIGFLGGALC